MSLRRFMLATAAAAAVIACAVMPPAASAQVTERLPDLVADPPTNPQLQTYAQPDGNHLLLRFDGYVHNQGQGAFEMRGSARVGQRVHQRRAAGLQKRRVLLRRLQP